MLGPRVDGRTPAPARRLAPADRELERARARTQALSLMIGRDPAEGMRDASCALMQAPYGRSDEPDDSARRAVKGHNLGVDAGTQAPAMSGFRLRLPQPNLPRRRRAGGHRCGERRGKSDGRGERRGERRGRPDGPGVGSAALPIVGDSVAVAGRWQSGGAGGQALRGHHGAVRAVAATGRRVVSVAADRTLRFWCRCRARAAGQLLSPRAGAGPGGERWRAAWRCGPHCGAVCARGLRRRGGADLGLA